MFVSSSPWTPRCDLSFATPPCLLAPTPLLTLHTQHPLQIASAPFVLSFFKPTNLDYRFEDLERTFGANSDPVTGKVLDLQDLRQQNAAKILKYGFMNS